MKHILLVSLPVWKSLRVHLWIVGQSCAREPERLAWSPKNCFAPGIHCPVESGTQPPCENKGKKEHWQHWTTSVRSTLDSCIAPKYIFFYLDAIHVVLLTSNSPHPVEGHLRERESGKSRSFREHAWVRIELTLLKCLKMRVRLGVTFSLSGTLVWLYWSSSLCMEKIRRSWSACAFKMKCSGERTRHLSCRRGCCQWCTSVRQLQSSPTVVSAQNVEAAWQWLTSKVIC